MDILFICLYIVAYVAIGIVCASIAYRFDRNARQCDMGLTFTFFWPVMIPIGIFFYSLMGIDALIWKLSGRK